MRVGLREANQRFSSLVRAVRNGREVILTERGTPVAVLKPLPERPDLEATLRRMEASGQVKLPIEKGRLPPWKPLRIRGASLSSTIREDRDAD